MIIDFNRYNGGGGSGSGVTPQDVQAQIDSALTPYWDSAETQDAIDEAISGFTPIGTGLPVGYDVVDWGLWNSQAQIVTVDGKLFGDDLYDVPGFHHFEDGYSDEERGYVMGQGDVFGYYDEDENFVPVFLPAGTYAILNTNDDQYNGKVINLFYGKVGDEDVIYNNSSYAQQLDSIGLKSPLFTITEPTCPTTNGGYYILDLDYTDKPSVDEQFDEVFSAISETQRVAAAGLNQLEGRIDELSAATPSVDLSGYYTSAQTEDAISAATSGKADAVNITENNNTMYFPTWTSQGVIKGYTGGAFNLKEVKINNQSNMFPGYLISNLPHIYAPESAGTAGEILVSTGNGAPVWSAVTFPDVSNYVTSAQVETQIVEKNYITSAATANMVTSTSVSTIWKGTQAQYDAIVDKDPNTFYIIL